MLQHIIRRVLLMIPTLLLISVISFTIIELPPGSYLNTYIANLEEQGTRASLDQIEALKHRYGLDKPIHMRYLRWIWAFVRGDMGFSMLWDLPVSQLVFERIPLTFVISLSTTLLIWIVAFPIGVYSAVSQYSLADYIFTAISFIGLGIPDFVFALVLLWFAYSKFGIVLTGLFSRPYLQAPWTFGRVLDLLKHIWVPIMIIGVTSTAGMIRTMRANMLDELGKPYVVTARAKGVSERRLILKYPVRVAINPFISTVGWLLPSLISGTTIVSVVLNLHTTGPLLLNALKGQDMYLAGSFIMMLSILTVIGTLISDILLAWVDPRVRYAE